MTGEAGGVAAGATDGRPAHDSAPHNPRDEVFREVPDGFSRQDSHQGAGEGCQQADLNGSRS